MRARRGGSSSDCTTSARRWSTLVGTSGCSTSSIGSKARLKWGARVPEKLSRASSLASLPPDRLQRAGFRAERSFRQSRETRLASARTRDGLRWRHDGPDGAASFGGERRLVERSRGKSIALPRAGKCSDETTARCSIGPRPLKRTPPGACSKSTLRPDLITIRHHDDDGKR